MNGFCATLVMRATSSPLAAEVTPAWLTRCAAACLTQLRRDVAPIYGGSYDVGTGDPTAPVQLAFVIVDSLPDAPGAIAYHDVNGADVPVAFLALSTCSTLDDVSTAISHELCETAGDASCDLWADDGQGHEWARELCDAVESNSYPIDLADGAAPILVSDFVVPGFFGANDPGPYSFLQFPDAPKGTIAGLPSAPFATPAGGYQIQRSSGGGETQVTGAVRAHRAAHKAHWSSRTFRRGARPAP